MENKNHDADKDFLCSSTAGENSRTPWKRSWDGWLRRTWKTIKKYGEKESEQ